MSEPFEEFEEDMNRRLLDLGMCPGCQVAGTVESWAVSRFDGETKVCDACGAFEALVLARGGLLDSPGREYTGGRQALVPATVDIVDVVKDAVQVTGAELAAGDHVFDAMGGRHLVKAVTHFARKTRFQRDDLPYPEYIENDETITVIRGAKPAP